MVALSNDCPPLDGLGACAALPLAFVRLRYYFGKRMGVADFVDEALYHAAKMRFHNQHLHGLGVLCGLKVSVFNGVTPPSQLRVTKGAALDRCGREIIVGNDQCIDVNAWIQRELATLLAQNPSSTWPTSDLVNGKLPLAVVLRYRECSTSPEPAPRDPCSCDDGGTEFGRVREGFELDLMNATDAAPFRKRGHFPPQAAVNGALADSISGRVFDTELANLVTSPANDPSGDDWLVLATADVTLDAKNNVTALTFENIPPPMLLETAELQELLLRSIAAGWEPGALVPGGPTIVGVQTTPALLPAGPTPAFTFAFNLNNPLVGGTVDQATVTLNRLGTNWASAGGALTMTYITPATGPAIQVAAAGDAQLVRPGSGVNTYRLSITSTQDKPIVDAKMRPLLPLHFSWDFTVDSTGAVTTASFA